MFDLDLLEACEVVIVPRLRSSRWFVSLRGVSSFSVFALVCALFSQTVCSQFDSLSIRIPVVDDCDSL